MGHRFIRAEHVTPQIPRWLLEFRIPFGTVTLVVGRDGSGKSTFARWLAAGASRGWLTGSPLDVHLALLEDGPAEITQPGLVAADADCERVELALGEGWRFPRDLAAFEAHIRSTQAKLVVLDPLAAIVPGLASERAGGALRALAAIADRQGAALVLIHHTIKGARDADTAIAGSYNLKAAARAILFWDALGPTDTLRARIAALDAGVTIDEASHLCLLRAHKQSYAELPAPLLFERRSAPHSADASRDIAVVELLAELRMQSETAEEPGLRERERAKRAILALLVQGPVPGTDLEGLVMSITGASRTSVQRARRELTAERPPVIECFQRERQHLWRLVVPNSLA